MGNVSGKVITDKTSATRLIRAIVAKMERQPNASSNRLPNVGEAMGPSVSNMTRTVMTFAAFRPSYRSLTMARPTTMPALAPMACMKRSALNHAMSLSNGRTREVTVKRTVPIKSGPLRP